MIHDNEIIKWSVGGKKYFKINRDMGNAFEAPLNLRAHLSDEAFIYLCYVMADSVEDTTVFEYTRAKYPFLRNRRRFTRVVQELENKGFAEITPHHSLWNIDRDEVLKAMEGNDYAKKIVDMINKKSGRKFKINHKTKALIDKVLQNQLSFDLIEPYLRYRWERLSAEWKSVYTPYNLFVNKNKIEEFKAWYDAQIKPQDPGRMDPFSNPMPPARFNNLPKEHQHLMLCRGYNPKKRRFMDAEGCYHEKPQISVPAEWTKEFRIPEISKPIFHHQFKGEVD
jgi:hypothetical protein